MTEQEIFSNIHYCSKRIEECEAEITAHKKQFDEIDELCGKLSGLENSLLDFAESADHKIGLLERLISRRFLNQASTVLKGSEYKNALGGLGESMGVARRKQQELEDKIRLLKQQIANYQEQINNYYYQLSLLRAEANECQQTSE